MRSRKGERKENNDAIVFQLKTKKESINFVAIPRSHLLGKGEGYMNDM